VASTLVAATTAATAPTLLKTLRHLLDISTSFICGGGDRQLQDGVKDPRSGRGAHRIGGRARGASRIEQPSLEDDPNGPIVSEERDVRDAESREFRDEFLAQAELASSAVEQHHHHRHVPLLSTG
jgi:hypothetical protein